MNPSKSFNPSLVDDAIISVEPMKKTVTQAPKGGERELEKTTWLSSSKKLETLDELVSSKEKFDQFAGKNPSTYDDSLYSTKLEMGKISNKDKIKGI